MIDRHHDLPLSRQAKVLGISRASDYYLPRAAPAADLALMRRIDALHLEHPFAGCRMLQGLLNAEDHVAGRLHVATLMRRMGIEALRRPKTSKRAPGHVIFPYLLRKLPVTRPNQVWAMDITYIPMARGFGYLAAVVDWFSRKVLAWRLSITMDTAFCIEAVEDALARFGKPEIFNTDQGSQFTSREFTGLLIAADIRISHGRLPARLCQRVGGSRLDRPLSRLLQHPEASSGPGQTDARPGLLQRAAANPGRGITKAETHLATAPKLFRSTEPALSSS